MTPQELRDLEIAVAKHEGYNGVVLRRYTRDWSAVGPLLEKYKLTVAPRGKTVWYATGGSLIFAVGTTPLIAICKAVLAIPLLEGRE